MPSPLVFLRHNGLLHHQQYLTDSPVSSAQSKVDEQENEILRQRLQIESLTQRNEELQGLLSSPGDFELSPEHGRPSAPSPASESDVRRASRGRLPSTLGFAGVRTRTPHPPMGL